MDITYELPGWELFFDDWNLENLAAPGDDSVTSVIESLRNEFGGKSLADHPVTSAVRKPTQARRPRT